MRRLPLSPIRVLVLCGLIFSLSAKADPRFENRFPMESVTENPAGYFCGFFVTASQNREAIRVYRAVANETERQMIKRLMSRDRPATWTALAAEIGVTPGHLSTLMRKEILPTVNKIAGILDLAFKKHWKTSHLLLSKRDVRLMDRLLINGEAVSGFESLSYEFASQAKNALERVVVTTQFVQHFSVMAPRRQKQIIDEKSHPQNPFEELQFLITLILNDPDDFIEDTTHSWNERLHPIHAQRRAVSYLPSNTYPKIERAVRFLDWEFLREPSVRRQLKAG